MLVHMSFSEYDKIGRTYVFDIDFWHLFHVLAYKKEAVHHETQSIRYSKNKAGKVVDAPYCVDAMRVGNVSETIPPSLCLFSCVCAVYSISGKFDNLTHHYGLTGYPEQ
jgi:hypothetical protein